MAIFLPAHFQLSSYFRKKQANQAQISKCIQTLAGEDQTTVLCEVEEQGRTFSRQLCTEYSHGSTAFSSVQEPTWQLHALTIAAVVCKAIVVGQPRVLGNVGLVLTEPW